MNKPQALTLAEDLHNRIQYWVEEADMTYAEVVGTLELVKLDLLRKVYFTPDKDNSTEEEL